MILGKGLPLPRPEMTSAWRDAGPGAVAVRTRAGALAYGVLVFLYLAWQLQPAGLGAFTDSYDEGVYAQTARVR